MSMPRATMTIPHPSRPRARRRRRPGTGGEAPPHPDMAPTSRAVPRGARSSRRSRDGRAPGGGTLLAGLLLILALLAGCAGSPPPLVGQAPTPAPAQPQLQPDPTQLRIGVDDLGGGFQVAPHA